MSITGRLPQRKNNPLRRRWRLARSAIPEAHFPFLDIGMNVMRTSGALQGVSYRVSQWKTVVYNLRFGKFLQSEYYRILRRYTE